MINYYYLMLKKISCIVVSIAFSDLLSLKCHLYIYKDFHLHNITIIHSLCSPFFVSHFSSLTFFLELKCTESTSVGLHRKKRYINVYIQYNIPPLGPQHRIPEPVSSLETHLVRK